MARNNSVTRRTGRPGIENARSTGKIIETNPFTDPANRLNAEAHAALLGGNKDVWGSPIMKDASVQRKGYRIVEKSARTIEKEVYDAMFKDAMMIVKRGMPRSTEDSARLTEIFGPKVIVRLLELHRRYTIGEI